MQKLQGIIPPMATPLTESRELDLDGTGNLLKHLLDGGVHGVFLLGTTGEGPSVSGRMKRRLIEFCAAEIAGKIPIMVAISDTAFEESVNLARFCADKGVDALVMTPPYYFPSGQPELLEYFTDITKELPLPLFIYNMPMMTKTHIELDTVKRIADLDGVAGIKDSSCEMIYYHDLLNEFRDREDFTVLIGPEEMLAESVLFGGDGGIPGGANVFPRLYVDIYEAAARRDISRIIELQKKIFTLRKIYSYGQYASSLIKGVKCALSCLGICGSHMAEPFHSFGEEQRRRITAVLEELAVPRFQA